MGQRIAIAVNSQKAKGILKTAEAQAFADEVGEKVRVYEVGRLATTVRPSTAAPASPQSAPASPPAKKRGRARRGVAR